MCCFCENYMIYLGCERMGEKMKKLKMFGFTLMAMLVGIVNISALELGGSISTDGKLSYSKTLDEQFAYQVIRITKAEWDTISADVQTGLEKIEANTEQLQKDFEGYNNAVKVFEKAKEEYEADADNEEKKLAYDVALADMNAYVDYVTISLNELKSSMTSMMNVIQKVAPYTVDSMTEVSGNETTGEITVDMTGANEDDVFVVWIKSDEYSEFSDDNVLIGEIYTKDGVITPEIPSDVEVPTVNPTTPESPKEEIKNPKTGVSMPVALGAGVIALAGAGMFIVSKKKLFKQL